MGYLCLAQPNCQVVFVEALEALQGRTSAPRLTGDVDDAMLDGILRAGVRAPDHAQLRPWRILIVAGDSRARLGELFVRARLVREPDETQENLTRLRNKPFRAPVVIVVVAKIVTHPKVPEVEQLLSAGAVAQNMLLAAHAQGLGAMWRTGAVAYDSIVHSGLGLADNEKIIGFLYIGEIDGKTRRVPPVAVEQFVEYWGRQGNAQT